MSTYPELIQEFIFRLAATCPPGYELDTMSLDTSNPAANVSTVTVWWKPVASPLGD